MSAVAAPDSLRTETAADRRRRDTHLNVLVAASRFGDEMEQVCRTEGLSVQQFHVLWVVCLHPDAATGIAMGAIADGLVNRASDTTRLIDRLVASGHVLREPSPTDRRRVLVSPTAKGNRAVARLVPRLRDFHRRQWSNLTTAELDELSRLITKALWGNDA